MSELIKISLSYFLSLVLCSSLASAASLTVSDNAFVRKNQGDQNDAQTLVAKSNGQDGNTRLVYLRFDINELADETIEYASLDLYWISSSGDETVTLYAISDGTAETNWDSSLTWATRPDGTGNIPNGNTSDSAIANVSLTDDGGNSVVMFDITDALPGLLAADTNGEITFVLRGGSNKTHTFASMDNTSGRPAPALTINTPTLNYTPTLLSEATANDGTISETISISLTTETFTANVVSGGFVTASNTPAGLTPVFTRDSDTQLTLALNGTATAHGSADSISNFSVTFTDSAFTGGNAADIAGSERADLRISFNDPVPPELSYSPTTLDEGVSNEGQINETMVINLSDETFTADVVSSGYVTATNVPSGLTAVFTRNSNTRITLALSGYANAHATSDSISNLGVSFANAAFNGGDAGSVVSSTRNNLSISFDDPEPTDTLNANYAFAKKLWGDHYSRHSPMDYFPRPNDQPGRTYISLSYTNDDDPYIWEYDHLFEKWEGPVKVGTNQRPTHDQHGNPDLIIDNQGYIHVWYGGHGGASNEVYARSERPLDISSWIHPEYSGDMTYPRSFCLDDDSVRVFFRYGNITDAWAIKHSTDNGLTWSAPRILIQKTNANNTGARYYAQAQKYPHKDRIGVFVSDQLNDATDEILCTDFVFYFEYDLHTDIFYTAAGDVIPGTENGMSPGKLHAHCLVYDYGPEQTADTNSVIRVGGSPALGPDDSIYLIASGGNTENWDNPYPRARIFRWNPDTGTWPYENFGSKTNNADSRGGGELVIHHRLRTTNHGASYTSLYPYVSFPDASWHQARYNLNYRYHPDASVFYYNPNSRHAYLYGASGTVPFPKMSRPVELGATQQADDSVELEWSGANIEGFDSFSVYRSTSEGLADYERIATGLTTREFNDNSAVMGQTYYYVATVLDTNGTQSSFSDPVSITLSSIDPNPDLPPTVSLTSPSDGATIELGTSVTVSATASDAESSVSQVEFFADGQSIGMDSSAPYSMSWLPLSSGTYVIRATATDDEGFSAGSGNALVTVTVNEIEEVITDGDFSSGQSDWKHWTHSSADADFTFDNGHATVTIHDGGSALWEVQLYHTSIELYEGEDYTLSFDAKSMTGERTIEVLAFKNGQNDRKYAQQSFDIDTNLKKYGLTFTAPETETDTRVLFYLGGEVANTVMIDNVRLTTGAPPSNYLQWKDVSFQGSDILPQYQVALEDADLDGLINLQEYAFGTDPKAAASRKVILNTSFDAIEGAEHYTFTYPRRAVSNGISYRVGYSYDLVNWNYTEDKIEEVSSTPVSQEIEWVKVRYTGPTTADKVVFIRIEVEKLF